MIYRYFRTHYLETLLNRELLVRNYAGANDPFEARIAFTGDVSIEQSRELLSQRWNRGGFRDTIRRKHQNLKTDKAIERHFNRNFEKYAQQYAAASQNIQLFEDLAKLNNEVVESGVRMVCFSSDQAQARDEVLMWSHYAGEHKGARIGFTFPSEYTDNLRRVTYGADRVCLSAAVDPQGPEGQESLRLVLTHKSKAWEYEHEYRLLVHPKNCYSVHTENRTLEFFQFDRSWAKCLDFGPRVPETQIRAEIRRLREAGIDIQVRRASLHPTQFAFEYSQVNE